MIPNKIQNPFLPLSFPQSALRAPYRLASQPHILAWLHPHGLEGVLYRRPDDDG